MRNPCFNLFIICTLALVGCNSNTLSEKEYYKYLNNPDNNLISIKEVNGFELKVKYLPPPLLAYRESNTDGGAFDKPLFDSLLNVYEGGYSFLFSIEDKNIKPGQDIVQYGVTSEVEFKQRFNELHFNLSEYVWMETDSTKKAPQLSILESTFELSGPKTFYLVFEQEENKSDIDEVKVVFNDIFFGTGINRFTFNTTDLRNTPQIQVSKK